MKLSISIIISLLVICILTYLLINKTKSTTQEEFKNIDIKSTIASANAHLCDEELDKVTNGDRNNDINISEFCKKYPDRLSSLCINFIDSPIQINNNEIKKLNTSDIKINRTFTGEYKLLKNKGVLGKPLRQMKMMKDECLSFAKKDRLCEMVVVGNSNSNMLGQCKMYGPKESSDIVSINKWTTFKKIYNSEFSISFCININNVTPWNRIIFQHGDNIDRPLPMIKINKKKNDIALVILREGNTKAIREALVLKNIPLRKWSHIGITFSKGIISMYLNGKLSVQKKLLSDMVWPSSNEDATISPRWTRNGQYSLAKFCWIPIFLGDEMIRNIAFSSCPKEIDNLETRNIRVPSLINLKNGWEEFIPEKNENDYKWSPLTIKKKCNIVFINGLIHRGFIQNGTSVIGEIPLDFRPDSDRCSIVCGTIGDIVTITVKKNGKIILNIKDKKKSLDYRTKSNYVVGNAFEHENRIISLSNIKYPLISKLNRINNTIGYDMCGGIVFLSGFIDCNNKNVLKKKIIPENMSLGLGVSNNGDLGRVLFKTNGNLLVDRCNVEKARLLNKKSNKKTLAKHAINIQMGKTNNCLAVKNKSRMKGSQIITAKCNINDDSQHWKYNRNKKNLENIRSGMCLEVSGASKSNNVDMIQMGCSGADNQKFEYSNIPADISENGKEIKENRYLIAKHSNKCVTYNYRDKPKVVQSKCNGKIDQQWVSHSGKVNPFATVCLFTECNYGGKKVCVGLGKYKNAKKIGIKDNSISSVKIPSGFIVTFFDLPNFKGRKLRLEGPKNISHCSKEGKKIFLNNKYSSLKIELDFSQKLVTKVCVEGISYSKYNGDDLKLKSGYRHSKTFKAKIRLNNGIVKISGVVKQGFMNKNEFINLSNPIGCFKNDMRKNFGRGISLEDCAKKSRDNGFTFFGMSGNNTCYADKGFGSKGKSENCNNYCIKKNKDKFRCGDSESVTVFDNNISPSLIAKLDKKFRPKTTNMYLCAGLIEGIPKIFPTMVLVSDKGDVVWLGSYNLTKKDIRQKELYISLDNICYLV